MKNEPKSSFKFLTQLIYLVRVPDPHCTYRNAVPNLNEASHEWKKLVTFCKLTTVSTICWKGWTESCPNILQFAKNPGAPGDFAPWPPTRVLPLYPNGCLHSPHTPSMCAGNKVTCYKNFVTSYKKYWQEPCSRAYSCDLVVGHGRKLGSAAYFACNVTTCQRTQQKVSIQPKTQLCMPSILIVHSGIFFSKDIFNFFFLYQQNYCFCWALFSLSCGSIES